MDPVRPKQQTKASAFKSTSTFITQTLKNDVIHTGQMMAARSGSATTVSWLTKARVPGGSATLHTPSAVRAARQANVSVDNGFSYRKKFRRSDWRKAPSKPGFSVNQQSTWLCPAKTGLDGASQRYASANGHAVHI
jgi:hypothetical protein